MLHKILIALFLCGVFTSSAYSADTLREAGELITGPILMAVMLFVIIVSAYNFFMGSIRAALIGIACCVFIILVRSIIYGHFSGGTLAIFTSEIQVYGQDPASPVHRGGQVGSYQVIEGYVSMGSYLLSRVLGALFSIQGVSIVLILAAILTVVRAVNEQSIRPFVWFIIRIVLLGSILLLPLVSYMGRTAANPVYEVFTDISGATVDQNHAIPMLPALVINGGTQIAESIGERIQIGTNDYDQLIINASRNSRLPASIASNYFAFSDNCFTSVLNLSRMGFSGNTSVGPELPRFAHIIRERLANYQGIAHFNMHALSQPSERLFTDIDYDGFIINDSDDSVLGAGVTNGIDMALRQRLMGTYAVVIPGRDYVAPISPFRATNRLSGIRFHDKRRPQASMLEMAVEVLPFGFLMAGGSSSDAQLAGRNRDWSAGRMTMVDDRSLLTKPLMEQHLGEMTALKDSLSGRPYARLFCGTSVVEEPFSNRGDWSNMTASISELPPVWRDSVGDDLVALRLNIRDAGAYLRKQIGERYLWRDSQELCYKAAEDYMASPDFWGCLVAGHYTTISGDTFDRDLLATVRGIQQRFDSEYREYLNSSAASTGTPVIRPRIQWSRPPMGFPGFTVAGEGIAPNRINEYSAFVDIFMFGQGIQNQVGMSASVENFSQADDMVEDNAFLMIIRRIGGVAISGLSSVFAWIANVMSNVALALYPHVMGLSYFLLLLVFPVFAVMSFFPGKGMIILEWCKAAVWVSLWPLAISIGLGLINQTGVYSMSNFFTSNLKGTNISEDIMKIFGAMFIFMAPAMTGLLLNLSFGALSGAIGGIAGTGFRLAGAAAMLGSAMVALAAAAIPGVGGAVAGGVMGASNAIRKGAGDGGNPGGGGSSGPSSDNGGDDGGKGSTKFPRGSAGQEKSNGPGLMESIAQGARHGAMTGMRMGTNVGDVAQSTIMTAAQVGDFSGGELTRGAYTGSQGGHTMHRGLFGQGGDGGGGVVGGVMGTPGAVKKLLGGRGSAEGEAGMKIGEQLVDKAESSAFGARSTAYNEAGDAFASSSAAYEDSGDYADAAVAGHRAFESYMQAGETGQAEASAQEAMRNARLAIQNNPGDRRAVGMAQLVLGGLSTQMGISKLSQAKGLTGNAADEAKSSATGYLREGETALQSAQQYYGGEAVDGLSRMRHSVATDSDLGHVREYGTAAIDAARLRDRIGSAEGRTSKESDLLLERFQQEAGLVMPENNLNAKGVLSDLRSRIGDTESPLALPERDIGRNRDRY